MKAENAIEQAKHALAYGAHLHPDVYETLIEAAEKWAVIAWMRKSGFADEYRLSFIMENWPNFIAAYRKEKEAER